MLRVPLSGLGQRERQFLSLFFPLELLVISRICCRLRQTYQGKLDLPRVHGNWVFPSSAFVLALLWCVLQCNLGFACPATNCVRCVCFAGSNLPIGSATALHFYFCGTA